MLKNKSTIPSLTDQPSSNTSNLPSDELGKTSAVDESSVTKVDPASNIAQVNDELPSTAQSNRDVETENFSRFRLGQDYAADLALKKQQVDIPVRKPNNQTFFRVHSDEKMRFAAMVLFRKDDQDIYLVDRPLWPSLLRELVPMMLYLAITRDGVVFFLPIRMAEEDGRINSWHASAHAIVQQAMTSWVRLMSNRPVGAYECVVAMGDYGEPSWPESKLEDLLRLAFKDRIIETPDHLVLRKLRGEI